MTLLLKFGGTGKSEITQNGGVIPTEIGINLARVFVVVECSGSCLSYELIDDQYCRTP